MEAARYKKILHTVFRLVLHVKAFIAQIPTVA